MSTAGPFRRILELSIGDVVARAVSFLSFLFLARVLGVDSYGVLEFVLSIFAYLQFMADGGLELWATRTLAQGRDLHRLAPRVIALRSVLTAITVAVLVGASFVLPGYEGAQQLLLLFLLTLLVQVIDLRWAMLGLQQMRSAAIGMTIAQLGFAVLVFAVVRRPEQVLWVPIARFAGNLLMASYFLIRVRANLRRWSFRGALRVKDDALRVALTLGASRLLALLSFNFDTVMLGFLRSSAAVGLYNAAYRPLGALLAAASTFFQGLFSALARAEGSSRAELEELARRSLQLACLGAVPVAVLGTGLAEPAVRLLYSDEYLEAATVLRLLSWSAALVLLRGTFRQTLAAVGHQRLDLYCAVTGSAANILLNLILIPRYGLLGAACATILSEVLWLLCADRCFRRVVVRPAWPSALAVPALGGVLMALGLWLLRTQPWLLALVVAVVAYTAPVLLVPRTRRLVMSLIADGDGRTETTEER